MQQINEDIDPQIWAEIQETFNKIKQDTGVEPEEDYMKELEDLLGMSVDEMDKSHMEMMKTKTLGVELVHDDAKFPSYAYPSDSGFDLYSTIEYNLPPLGRALIPTGIKLSIPEEYEIQIRPKSGLALNQGLTVLNTPGTVDSGYVGEIKVIVFNTNNETVTISKGMKIAQAVLCPVVNGRYVSLNLLDKVEDKDRGDNGFGSTGIK
jgi:dUTP pyrophosphatase